MFAVLFIKVLLFDDKTLSFLREQAEKRTVRYQEVPQRRGSIVDRNNRPLAISSKVFTVYVDPLHYVNTQKNAHKLSGLLHSGKKNIYQRITNREHSRYVVLQHNVEPFVAKKVRNLAIKGVYLAQNFKRFYPAAETVAQLIGYTDNQNKGIEGLELAFNNWLQSRSGERKVLIDAQGHLIRDIEVIESPKVGKQLELAIDLRVQEIAYETLKKHVKEYQAKQGSIIMVNPHNGEIIALASYPSFNPNNRNNLNYLHVRNRVFTDAFEPGSVFKPFTVLAALDNHRYDMSYQIDTGDSRFFDVGRHRIADAQGYGVLSLESIIAKSSNIGAAKLGLTIGSDTIMTMVKRFSFNGSTGSYFPGETEGKIPYGKVSHSQLATISYGYGLQISLAQLVRAYSAIANGGVLLPLSLTRQKRLRLQERIIDTDIALKMRNAMKKVTREGGTGKRAAITNYEVAGKTGTVHKYISGEYSKNKYRSLFVGMVPADKPELVAAILIDEPHENYYYGGEVAAPVFSEVVKQSFRLLKRSPDARPNTRNL